MFATYLLVDMLQRPVRVLAVADAVAAHTSLAGVLLSLDQHVEDGFARARAVGVVEEGWRRTTVEGSKRAARERNTRKMEGIGCERPVNGRRVDRIESSEAREHQIQSGRV
jgi:hypothetical protein